MGFVADEVDVPRRFAGATPGRLGGTFSFFTPFVASLACGSFSFSVSTSDASPVVSSPDNMSAGASSVCPTSGVSTSAILVVGKVY